MDYSRKQDLIEISEEYKKAQTTSRKQYLERLSSKIMRESGSTESARQNLLRAVRAGDRRKVNYYQDILSRKEMQATNGLGWQKRLVPSL